MKKILFSMFLLLSGLIASAQNEAYNNAMKGFLTKMQAANSAESYQPLANGFERIANAEPQQWLPRYYAAMCYVMQAMMQTDKSKIDGLVDLAENHLQEARKIQEHDEITILRALCKSARIGVDAMTRGMKYGSESAELLEMAKKTSPDNPRIYYLQGQSLFYTPEAFGGGKAKAKVMYEKAVSLFASFQPSSEFMPNWGADQATRMLATCNE
jgi:hypothetical protein